MNNGAEQKAELTELERVKMENYALKHNALQQQMNMNLAERTAYIQKIEVAHPGYHWTEQGGLVKVEPATGPAKDRRATLSA